MNKGRGLLRGAVADKTGEDSRRLQRHQPGAAPNCAPCRWPWAPLWQCRQSNMPSPRSYPSVARERETRLPLCV